MPARIKGTRVTWTHVIATDKTVMQVGNGYRCSECAGRTLALVQGPVTCSMSRWHVLVEHDQDCRALTGGHGVELDVAKALAAHASPTGAWPVPKSIRPDPGGTTHPTC